ncbi:MAG: T9SS type A sorting domain-containing protein [Bacteroidota bacterium]
MLRAVAPLALALFVSAPALAQSHTFTVQLDERTDLVNAPAVHSGATAEHDGLWLVVSGRTNGLHGFGAPAFPREYENGDLIVYDRETDTVWSASTDGLDTPLAEALRVTNGQFLARGDSLILVGGYGYRSAADDGAGGMATLGTMTVLDVPGVIEAIQTGGDLAPHITQPVVWDDALAVAGGHLVEVDGKLALVGGNRFDGEYGGSFVQTYTQAVRTLDLGDDGLTGATEITDPQLHRRDGNVAPIVLDSGEIGVGIYGGVFRPDTQGAFLRPILLDGDGIEVAPTFEQHVGHYTSPVLPMYSAAEGEMHTVFFGGINAFTWDDVSEEWMAVGNPPFIPFVDDIGVVSREGGVWSERRLNVRMPGLLGTNAMFFYDPDVVLYADDIVDFDRLKVGSNRIGWIVGGIEAGAPSFGQTWASERVLEVVVVATINPATGGEAPDGFRVAEAAPNPARGLARVDVTVETPQAIRAEVLDVTGRRVAVLHDGPLATGVHALTWQAGAAAPGLYLVRVSGARGVATRRVVLAR